MGTFTLTADSIKDGAAGSVANLEGQGGAVLLGGAHQDKALPVLRGSFDLAASTVVDALGGALQNRLEHTINNLDVAVENLSAANSRIRDPCPRRR